MIKNEEDKTHSIQYCLEIKKTIETFLEKMDVLFEEVEVFKGLSESGPKFIIKSRESGLLIGHRGENLRALSHLVRKVAQKTNQEAKFTVDINNYQEENLKRIRNQALAAVEKVKNSGRPEELEPMTAYERMIVHSLLGSDEAVETESVGEKSERRIVIKPKAKS